MLNKYFILSFLIFAFVGEIACKTNDVIDNYRETFNVRKKFGFQTQFFSNQKDQKVGKQTRKDHSNLFDILTDDEKVSLYNKINPNIDMVSQDANWNYEEEHRK